MRKGKEEWKGKEEVEMLKRLRRKGKVKKKTCKEKENM